MSIRNSELVAFAQQFASLVNAGIPLTRSLAVLGMQEENKQLKGIINRVQEKVEGGGSLSEAFAEYPGLFSRFFVSMIYAGEQGAGLPMALNRICDFLEREERVKEQIKGVFSYPMIIGGFAMVIVAFLIVVVAPIFATVYDQLNLSLPLPTRFLMGVSFIMRKLWWMILIALAALYIGYRNLVARPEGKDFFDRIKARLPFFGRLVRKLAVARFVRIFGDMFACNIPLANSLTVADRVVDVSWVSKAIGVIGASVQTGENLAAAFSRAAIFPPMVVQMVHAGEQSGNLGDMLGKCAHTMDRDIESSTRKILLMLEPSLIFILAGVVGFIALSVYLPMFELMKMAIK